MKVFTWRVNALTATLVIHNKLNNNNNKNSQYDSGKIILSSIGQTGQSENW
jgi:hypothetical protein